MASEIGKRIDEVIKIGIVPILKARGFRKKGRNFHKTVGEAVQVVNIQADRWNEGNAGRFTVNIGAYFRAVAEIAERWVVDGMPKEPECTVRYRLGMLMPEPGDKWWVLGKNTDDKHVAADVAEALNSYGLPRLERAGTRDGLRSLFAIEGPNLSFDPRSPIALEILDGNMEQAAALLRERLEEAQHNPGFVRQMTEWGGRHGLP